ncbi:MAG TPA: VWA domain-containing protein, partial [Candidatus Babeliales bacterium]|nr:VWA domain-containing protein [Candidatus Babeliales bacterium]
MKWGSWAQSWLWGLVGLALLLLAYRWYQQIQLLQKFNRAQLQGYSSGKNLVKIGLWCLALLALGLAALAPQRVGPGLMAEQRSRDVIIALDVSRSMLVSDLTPNRLTLAKQKIKHLIKLLNAERVGLILFSRTAFVQCPLTRDRAALELFLADVDAESLSAGGTNLAAAVQQALTMVTVPAAQQPARTISLVLFTDGEDFSQDLAQVKQAALAQHLAVFTVGVASPAGGPVPVLDQQ